MKKHLIFIGLLIASFAFNSCDEDYTDWANPQQNEEQEASTEATFEIALPSNSVISMEDIAEDSILNIASFVTTSLPGESTITFKSLTIEGEGVNYTLEENSFKVNNKVLNSLVTAHFNSKEYTQRELKVKVLAAITDKDGQSLQATSNETIIKFTPKKTPEAEQNYYIVGDFAGWDADHKILMQSEGDYIFSYTIEIDAAKYFKIFPESAFEGNNINWDKALGSEIDGDDSDSNTLVWNAANAIKTGKTGKIKIILDVKNFTFQILDESATSELFLTGSKYDWGKTWIPLTPVREEKGGFWKIIYLNKDEQFKFAPQAGWKNDFGMSATIDDQAEATITDNGGNITCGKSGWYLLHVTVIGEERNVHILPPNVYVIGECADGGWDKQLQEIDLFTVPETSEGEFISPDLKAGTLRLCVKLAENIGWYNSEFMVFDNAITYRGNGNDQPAVTVSANQKVYLNFTTEVGSIK